MAIKDRVVRWFIQNIIIPQQEIIDKPGFIVEAHNKADQDVFIREITLPEELIIELEKKIVLKFGMRGKKAIYSSGKMFGYTYATRSFFPKRKLVSKKEFESFIYLWMKYAEVLYGEIEYSFNDSLSTMDMKLKNFIVCSKNGLGYFLPAGCFAGFWAYLMDDYSIEFVQKKCTGRGDDFCECISGPPKIFEKTKSEIILSNTKPILWNIEMEKNINAMRPCRFNEMSFKDLLDSLFFDYSGGILTKDGVRYFIMDSSAMYFIESELLKIDSSNSVLFEVSFEFGKSLAKKEEKNYEQFIATFLSALGYGDIRILKERGKFRVHADYFPWTPYSDKISFALFRGIVSGMLSGFIGKTILLKKIFHEKSQGFLTIDASM